MHKKILIPVDLNEESSWTTALPMAVTYAKTFNAKLIVMTVVPDFGMNLVGSFFPVGFAEQAMAEARDGLDDLCTRFVGDDVALEKIVGSGTIYDDVIDTARRTGTDLIVLASHRPKLEDYLLGPNAARVVRHAGCSVLVVRP